MEFVSDSREDETIVTKLRDSVVVTSDEGSLLNYTVMKYSGISSNGSLMRRFTIGKLCSPPAGTSIKFHYGNRMTSGCVLHYPSDMMEFLKKTTRFHAISVVSESSLTRLDHASVGKVEKRKKERHFFIRQLHGYRSRLFWYPNICQYPDICVALLYVLIQL